MDVVRIKAAQQPQDAPRRTPAGFVAEAYALFVLTLAGNQISAITWLAGTAAFGQFELPTRVPL